MSSASVLLIRRLRCALAFKAKRVGIGEPVSHAPTRLPLPLKAGAGTSVNSSVVSAAHCAGILALLYHMITTFVP